MTDTVRGWVEAPEKKSTQRQRRDVLRNFVLATDFLPESDVPDTHTLSDSEKETVWSRVFQAAQDGIAKLDTKDKLVGAMNQLVDYMKNKGSSGTTISGHQLKLGKLFRWLELLTRDDLEKLNDKGKIRKVDSVNSTDDEQFTPEQVRDMLKLTITAKQRAELSFAVCTGARISEIAQVRLRDLELDRTPAIVNFPARHTKTKQKRFSFLSSECVQFIKAHLATRDKTGPSEWLFEGQPFSKHSHPSALYLQMRTVFAMAGLVPPPSKKKTKDTAGSNTGGHLKYHPHVFRGTCITFMKNAGFPPDWAEWLAGHEVGTQTHYLPTKENSSTKWQELCEAKFCFLKDRTPQELKSQMEENKKRIVELENKFEDGALRLHETIARMGKHGPIRFEKREDEDDEEPGESVHVSLGITDPKPKPNGQARRWENHAFYYAKCEYGSEDFDKALEDGYEQFGQLTKDGLAYLRKPKQA